jgi:hypothetical protein
MRWYRGWRQARTPGGGEPRLYWRGPIMVTLSEADARRFEAACTTLQISGELITQSAILAWLTRYEAGQIGSPLDHQRNALGSARRHGTYYFPQKSSKLPRF